jgi:hypothetical protein
LFVKHDLCLVHTFVGSLITLVHQLWNISWKIQCHFWKFGQRMHV